MVFEQAIEISRENFAFYQKSAKTVKVLYRGGFVVYGSYQGIYIYIIIIVVMYRAQIANTQTYILMDFLGCTVMYSG